MKRMLALLLALVLTFGLFACGVAPLDTEPVETLPVLTEPLDTEPMDTEPVETEPVETEPVENIECPDCEIGSFAKISKQGVFIKTGKGFLNLIKVKPEGKGEMPAIAWANGLK